ncbi:MAG: J domain-containing protein [Actinobacteria bacterium]|nr:J domain-containing protein [Actinomycetota bacterium]
MNRNLYDVLKVAPDAPPEVIRSSYHALMKSAHPDLGGDAMRAQELNEARDILLDPVARAEYDRTLTSTPLTPGADQAAAPQDAAPSWGQEASWDDPVVGEPIVQDVPRGDPIPSDPPTPAPDQAVPPPYNPTSPPSSQTRRHPSGVPPGGGEGTGRVFVPNGPRPGGAAGPPARELWRGHTTVERVTAWAWLLVSLGAPIGAILESHGGRGGNLAGNLASYAVLFLVSLHIAKKRLTRPKIPKRYVVWVLLALGLAIAASTDRPEGLIGTAVFGAWAALYVAAIETRRRRMWPTN